ncbi:MAG: cupin domain-containing protein [Fimbriimonadaceae bacterium]
MTPEIQRIVDELKLVPHQEGIFFSETYRHETSIGPDHHRLPSMEHRNLSTAIYSLLTDQHSSVLHRVRSDEVWHFYLGSPVELIVISPEFELSIQLLGPDVAAGQRPQILVPALYWQAARIHNPKQNDYALCGCTVTPGFAYEDYDEPNVEEMVASLPEHELLLRKICRQPGSQ